MRTDAGTEAPDGVPAEELRRLFEEARSAADRAYAPYSKFPVGAALLLADGSIICGANVENRSFGLTNCAERSAVFAAVSAGRTAFRALAIAAPKAGYPVGPCGACRQVLTEFAPAEMPVIFGPDYGRALVKTLGELYPFDSLHELAD
ncbi:MAG: cytidine deaminase [Treponemataceae bacterium]|nr:cytidine deaminase [Treponemataceae bacterium]